MENLNSEIIINRLIEKAELIRGSYSVFCDASDVDISWFSKFINRKIPNPTIKSLEVLEKALNDWNS